MQLAQQAVALAGKFAVQHQRVEPVVAARALGSRKIRAPGNAVEDVEIRSASLRLAATRAGSRSICAQPSAALMLGSR